MKALVSSLLAAVILHPVLPAADPPKLLLFHEGPDVVTPGLAPGKELVYRKEFFIPIGVLADQKALALPPYEQLPISAERAIELARKSVEPRTPDNEVVLLVQLCAYPPSGEKKRPSRRDEDDLERQYNVILYYLVGLISGGNEFHRVVLMDGTVLKSSLRELKKP